VTILPSYSAAYRLFVTNRSPEAIVLADSEISRARGAGAETAAALMLVWRGAARVDLGDAGGIDDVHEAYAILSRHAHPKAAVTANNLGELLTTFARFDEARAIFGEGRDWARRTGDASADAHCAIGLARLAYFAGRPDDARALLDEAVLDLTRTFAHAKTVGGYVLLSTDPEQVRKDAAAALVHAEQIQHKEMLLETLALAARAAHAGGDPEATDRALDRFMSSFHEQASKSIVAVALTEVSIVLAARGRDADLTAAAQVMHPSPWREAVIALAERRYADAAEVFDGMSCIPLRDAVRALQAGVRHDELLADG
jgi:tetratricopeptide (TPR) repeat protein